MLFLCLFLGAACVWDYTTRRIPNLLMVLLMCTGMMYSYMTKGWVGVAVYLLTVLIIATIMFIFFALSMIGGGDVKLIALAGGFFEGDRILWFVLYLMAAAAVISLIKLLCDRKLKDRFIYFFKYVSECMKSKELRPYSLNHEEFERNSIAMSGPILISVLMHWGGLY